MVAIWATYLLLLSTAARLAGSVTQLLFSAALVGIATTVLFTTTLGPRRIFVKPPRTRHLALYTTLGTVGVVLPAIPLAAQTHPFLCILPPNAGEAVAFALSAVGEELVFRGYMLAAVKGSAGIVFQAALFTLGHFSNPGFGPVAGVTIFAAGTYLALVVRRTGSVWNAAAFHFAWNIVQAKVLGLPVSGLHTSSWVLCWEDLNTPLAGWGFGVEASPITPLVLLLLIMIEVTLPKHRSLGGQDYPNPYDDAPGPIMGEDS